MCAVLYAYLFAAADLNAPHTAVRITHIPSGVVVTSQEEDLQFKNRATAIRSLRTKLYESGVLPQVNLGIEANGSSICGNSNQASYRLRSSAPLRHHRLEKSGH
jgi:protein subunit release factor A